MDRIAFWDQHRQHIVDDVAEYGWHCENVLANWMPGPLRTPWACSRSMGTRNWRCSA